ncbi:MAG TPA: hypothetical protein VK862_09755 [Afifellaceae bacterium]|nr:hypothetical protein [Afifellaceae bacterium]
MAEQQNPDRTTRSTEVDQDRRRALASMGKFAAYVAPAMTVLIQGDDAMAQPGPPPWWWWWRWRRRPRPRWCDSAF